jgi:D-alanine-D-alanine ligase
MRVLILHNDDDALAHGEQADRFAIQAVLEAAHGVEGACRERGFEVRVLPAPVAPAALCALLADERPEVVFNLVESVAGETRLEAAVAWLYELSGVAYTGSPAFSLSLALQKDATGALLRGLGVPVPAGRLLERGDEPLDGLAFPLIVKPVREDASHGISLESVCHDAPATRARARHLIERYAQGALCEEFVEGRELNVSVLGEGEDARTLALMEIDYSGWPASQPRLITYKAKWDEESEECKGSVPVPARDLSPALAERIRRVALAAYRGVGLRDYGRIDLRIHPERGPLVLDVNANPDLTPGAGLAKAAAASGTSYPELIEEIVLAAGRRRRPRQ